MDGSLSLSLSQTILAMALRVSESFERCNGGMSQIFLMA